MVTLKSPREIEAMHKSGQFLASIHRQLRHYIQAGMTTLEIDRFVHEQIEAGGGIPAQIGFEGYGYATCISVNDEICHGIPSSYRIKDGDIVKVDFCIDLNGAMSDSCWTYAIGTITDNHAQLMQVTHDAMMKGIEQATIGNRLGDISHAIQSYVEDFGYGIVRDFLAHGIGPSIHEEPNFPHYGSPGRGLRLKEGMTITIEPMITTGTWQVSIDDDGWTARTRDGSYCAQYEHTIAITKEGPLLLTAQ